MKPTEKWRPKREREKSREGTNRGRLRVIQSKLVKLTKCVTNVGAVVFHFQHTEERERGRNRRNGGRKQKTKNKKQINSEAFSGFL